MGLEQRGRVKWSHGRSNWKQEDHGGPEADSQRSKNVVKVATNPRKFRRQSEQNGENRVARFFRNLLLFSVLRFDSLLCKHEPLVQRFLPLLLLSNDSNNFGESASRSK
jgi:hypothetical protein